jgi:hypothetical protein
LPRWRVIYRSLPSSAYFFSFCTSGCSLYVAILCNRGMVASALSAPMAVRATMNTATVEWCFLCGPCQDVISTTS